jgi:pimeloyl-ACP methyl ester carboxylesterase
MRRPTMVRNRAGNRHANHEHREFHMNYAMSCLSAAGRLAGFALVGLTLAGVARAETGESFRIAGGPNEPALLVRHLAPTSSGPGRGRPVLYVHGATFPSALAVGYRFDGRSWMDELAAAGFDAWAFDFAGFGGSDRYPQMDSPSAEGEPLGRAPEAARQIERAVRAVLAASGAARVSIIAHSWGTIATGRFAGAHPELVDRLVFFGPIAQRDGPPAPKLGAWRYVSLEDQWTRFIADVPKGRAPVLLERHFATWGPAYLATDPTSMTRAPASNKTPNGPIADIQSAWAGNLAYDPALVRAPVALIRGEWDSLIPDADARWLFDALSASTIKRDVKIAAGTHLMLLEESRYALYRAAESFLLGDDTPPVSAHAQETETPGAKAVQSGQSKALTGKERLGPKWMDDQRVDNCKVPIDKRGAKSRPDTCS